MARERNNEKQIWLDGEFKDGLEKLQAKKKLITGKKVSLGELSREIIKSKGWEQIEKEILELDKNISKNVMKMGIRFDGDIFK